MVKSQGSRVFALGVGEAVTKATSARRLTAISGFNQYPAKPFKNADYTLVQNFDDLGQALLEIVAELCGAGVTVTKYVDKGDGKYVADRGWGFTVRVSVPGGFSWIRPKDATGASATASTDDNGVARFLWRPTKLTDASTVEVVDERTVPGYTFVKADCGVKAVRRSGRRTIQATSNPILTDERRATGLVRYLRGVQQDQPGDDHDPKGRDAAGLAGIQFHRIARSLHARG